MTEIDTHPPEFRRQLKRLNALYILSYVVVACIFATLVISSHESAQRRLARSYVHASRHSLVLHDFRQAVTSLHPAIDDGFLAVSILDADSQVVLALPNSSYLESLKSGLAASIRVPVTSDQKGSNQAEALAFVDFYYSRNSVVSLTGGGALILFILAVFAYRLTLSRMRRQYQELAQNQRAAAVSRLAEQVAHDIRSPLAALDMALKSFSEMSEEKRLLIRSSIHRIKDIANGLLEQNREANNRNSNLVTRNELTQKLSVELLTGLTDPIVTEKRMQFRSKIRIEIDLAFSEGAYGIFANIDAIEFKRILSNLINNAVEALGDSGKVTVVLGRKASDAIISVTDNGPGIPPEILARLGQRGETHGKEGGSGLGLYHARTTVESWRGHLEMDSTVGLGTTVMIKVPLVQAPKWFVEKLKISPCSKVIVLDDDSSIHRIWEGRFESVRIREENIEIQHFSTPAQLRSWIQEQSKEVLLRSNFLLDYELIGFSETGLDLMEELNIHSRSILVTSRFEEPQLRARCERLNVRLIPKVMAACVPIEVELPKISVDAILIDDDPLVHSLWQLAAKTGNKSVAIFATPEAFYEKSESYARNVPIYVDVSLPGGMRGEVVAEKIHTSGFTRIWLATGHAPEQVNCPVFIQGILGKDPPF